MARARWARVVAAAIVAAAAGAVVYAGTAARSADQSAVRAQRFELVDSQGRVRAALQIAAEPAPGMAGKARRQASRELASRRESPELIVYDADGKVRLRVPLDQLASALLARPSQMPSIITVLPGEPAILSGPLAPLSRDEMQRRFRAQLLHQ